MAASMTTSHRSLLAPAAVRIASSVPPSQHSSPSAAALFPQQHARSAPRAQHCAPLATHLVAWQLKKFAGFTQKRPAPAGYTRSVYVAVLPLCSVQQKFSLLERHTSVAPPLASRQVPAPAFPGEPPCARACHSASYHLSAGMRTQRRRGGACMHAWRMRAQARTGGALRLEEMPVEVEPGAGTSTARATSAVAKKRAHTVAMQRRAMVVAR
jgi:hypothetical protein